MTSAGLGLPALPPGLLLQPPDGLRDHFAASLRSRGWRVADVPPADLLVAPSPEAVPALRRSGIPVLAAGPPEAALLMSADTALIRPTSTALWRWWGPHRLYRDLALGVGEQAVTRVVIGYNWILVETAGGAGLAQTPAKGGAGCRPADLAGRSLSDLAALVEDWSDLRAAVGIAAINAHYNHADLRGADLDGLADIPSPAVVIGRFPDLARKLPGAAVIEREPRAGELPEIAADWLLPGAAGVAVTASTLSNRTLPRLIERANGAAFTLIGPGTPLTPRLFAYGIDRLAGFVLTDPDGAAASIAAGAGAADLRPFGRRVTLVR